MTVQGARYARLAAAELVGARGVDRLAAASAAVLGLGGLGWLIAQQLVMLLGRVVFLDRDAVRPENLGTQGFREEDCGVAKVTARARALRPLNPGCRIETIHKDLRSLGLAALAGVDLVFCAFDSRSARMVANQIALNLGLAWLDCAVDGSGRAMIGRVTGYGPGGACYLCARDAEGVGEILREGGAGCPVWRWGQPLDVGAPTLALPPVSAAVAGIAVAWGLKLLLGRGAGIAGSEALFDFDRSRVAVHRLRRNPACLADHRVLDPVPVVCATVGDAFRRAEEALAPPVVLELQRRAVACALRCPACGAERHPFKLLDGISAAEGVCECGQPMQPIELLDRFSRAEAAPFLDARWRELGLPPDDIVLASGPSGEMALWIKSSAVS